MLEEYNFDSSWLKEFEINNKNSKSFCILIKELIKFIEEIAKDVDNTKLHTIFKGGNDAKNFLVLKNIDIVLAMLGYEKKSDSLYKKSDISSELFKQRCVLVTKLLKKQLLNESTSKNEKLALPSNPYLLQSGIIASERPYNIKIAFPTVINTIDTFLRSIEQFSDRMMQYNDKKLIEYAKKIIPIQMLNIQTIKTMRRYQNHIAKNSLKISTDEPCFKDIFLYHLLDWFNKDFFEWINAVPCKICGNKTSSTMQHYTRIEDGILTEVTFCCSTETLFKRFDDIAILLQTRKGRCGEYANCFTFFCHALEYDVRLVVSQFDHLWTEVYSDFKKRWIHIDPSENVYDAPLMYQHGWKRGISYVTAFSMDDVQDVSWRYSNNHKITMDLRSLYTERELLDSLKKIREKRQKTITSKRKEFLSYRTCMELVELLQQRQPTDDELKGRTSGSSFWRMGRGETSTESNYTFILSDLDKNFGQFNLRYCCSTDNYEKYIIFNGEKRKYSECENWASRVNSMQNIFRKFENDWKMVYLARKEGKNMAKISWKFQFEDNCSIQNYNLKFETKLFENGQVQVDVINLKDGSHNIIGCNEFEIVAILKGYDNNKKLISWQSSQLFRQEAKSRDYPFDLSIVIEFK